MLEAYIEDVAAEFRYLAGAAQAAVLMPKKRLRIAANTAKRRWDKRSKTWDHSNLPVAMSWD